MCRKFSTCEVIRLSYDYGRAHKTRALKELVFRHNRPFAENYYLFVAAGETTRKKCAIAVLCKFNDVNFTTYDNKIVIVSLS